MAMAWEGTEAFQTGDPSISLHPYLKTWAKPGPETSWPWPMVNLDGLTWQKQVVFGAPAQRNRPGLVMEKANEDGDTEKVVEEPSLQIVLQTLSGRYYCQL